MRVIALVVAVALACALGGCASHEEQVTDATSAGVSAVRDSALALELAADGREWPPASDTALADALTELGDAHRTLLELVPTAEGEQGTRDRAATALDDALDTVAGARAALARGDDLAPWIDRLEQAAEALEGARP